MITIAAIQPAVPTGADEHAAMMGAAWRLAADAADQGATLLVLPECFNAIGLDLDAMLQGASEAGSVIEKARAFCRAASRSSWA